MTVATYPEWLKRRGTSMVLTRPVETTAEPPKRERYIIAGVSVQKLLDLRDILNFIFGRCAQKLSLPKGHTTDGISL
jgi:hypothetical protein